MRTVYHGFFPQPVLGCRPKAGSESRPPESSGNEALYFCLTFGRDILPMHFSLDFQELFSKLHQ